MTTFTNNPAWIRRLLATLGVAAALFAFASTGEAQSRTRGAAAAPTEQAQTTSGVVNIQTASSEQLQLLPGIGPAKAQAIVEHRERRAFRRVEDIMRVRGVGRATFRRLQPMITVDGPTTMAAPAPRPARAEAPEDTE